MAEQHQTIRIGVISDTHGLLREEALEALQGSDFIIHAGDIDTPEIVEALAKIAPVTAVRGNVDRGAWAKRLPQADVLEAGDLSIYVLHNLQELDLNPKAAGFAVLLRVFLTAFPGIQDRWLSIIWMVAALTMK